MKKAIAVIAVIAVLGILKIVADKPHNSASTSDSAATTSQAANPATSADKTSSASQSSTSYKDGTFTGSAEDTPYGTVKVAAVISGGKITGINFLQMPYDEDHSREVTAFAEPQLKQQAMKAQSAHIDFVTGATDTTLGFESSLQAALNQAANS